MLRLEDSFPPDTPEQPTKPSVHYESELDGQLGFASIQKPPSLAVLVYCLKMSHPKQGAKIIDSNGLRCKKVGDRSALRPTRSSNPEIDKSTPRCHCNICKARPECPTWHDSSGQYSAILDIQLLFRSVKINFNYPEL